MKRKIVSRKAKATSRAGRPIQSEASAREEALFDVAYSVFFDLGFSKASTSEIARRAGASKETIYSRYPTKAALFAALIERRVEKRFAAITPFAHADDAWEGALFDFCKQWVTAITEPQVLRLYEVVFTEASSFPDLAANYWEKGPGRARQILRKILETGVACGSLELTNTEWALEQLLGALTGTLLGRYTLKVPLFLASPDDVERWVRSVLDMFMRSHRADTQPTSRKPNSF